ncbi:hypothetical protein TSUD_93030 [Trifolium subterraneum]|uniref:F-box domain-containing protein n=1 Tax=Trifolium subterraneum TaxID=3900 RepID=A0A2Z6PGG7_TRISU|nr:hypothetical protein TSUD_93030 [Trifolium subterraneum]
MAGGCTISSSTDVHKIQRHNVGDDVNDMITDLPEGILLHILSLLPTEDAVRTSILAKKWRNMWTYLSVFNFETGRPRYESKDQNQKDIEPYAAQFVIELLRGLSSVKSLKIWNNTLECLSHAKDTLHLLPSFHNLTHLYVLSGSPESTNGVLLDILRKTPKLEVLTIPGVVLNYPDGEDLILNSVPYCFKSSLNRLSILHFYGHEYEIQFVTFILNNSPYLGEIEIHCSRHFSADTEKLTDVWNQLEDVGLERCVIEFLEIDAYTRAPVPVWEVGHFIEITSKFMPRYNYYESSDDEGDDDEAANSGMLPAAGKIGHALTD